MTDQTTHEEITRLMERIENGSATTDEYARYEHLLVESGMSKEFLRSVLESAGFSSWTELHKARAGARATVSPSLIGRISGFGLGVLLRDSLVESVRRELAG